MRRPRVACLAAGLLLYLSSVHAAALFMDGAAQSLDAPADDSAREEEEQEVEAEAAEEAEAEAEEGEGEEEDEEADEDYSYESSVMDGVSSTDDQVSAAHGHGANVSAARFGIGIHKCPPSTVCKRTRTPCTRLNGPCNVMRGSGGYTRATKCVAFSRSCGGQGFCGLTTSEWTKLAGSSDGAGPMGACMMATCGRIPAWYKYEDYRNIHKCISNEMDEILSACSAQKKRKKHAAKKAFIAKMSKCASRHGKRTFDQLTKSCGHAHVRQTMLACKDSVMAEMLAARVPVDNRDVSPPSPSPPLPVQPPFPPASPPPSPPPYGGCAPWCDPTGRGKFPWTTSCTWNRCLGCATCTSCKRWCTKRSEPFSQKCKWNGCRMCTECTGS